MSTQGTFSILDIAIYASNWKSVQGKKAEFSIGVHCYISVQWEFIEVSTV